MTLMLRNVACMPDPAKDDARTGRLSTIDPFTHTFHLGFFQKLKVVLMSVTLAPLKMLLGLLTLLAMWILASVGMCGVGDKEIQSRPLTGWRRCLQDTCFYLARTMFFFGGVVWIRMKGQRAQRKRGKAPIIVCAPHSTLFDTLAAAVMHSTPLSNSSIRTAPVLGKVATFWQIPFVDRDNKDKRRRVVDTICRRAKNVGGKTGWRRIFFYPEGTTTNGRALLRFKFGAFSTGQPVTPVLLRIDNHPDVIRWAWRMPHDPKTCLWLTLCQLYIRVEIEFLPDYVPTETEVDNPKKYAENVRTLMARRLHLPTSELTYDDAKKSVQKRNEEEEQRTGKSATR